MTHTHHNHDDDDRLAAKKATELFEAEIGATGVNADIVQVGNEAFLKFTVGMDAPLYDYAIRATQRALSTDNQFRGTLQLHREPSAHFPESLEASCLATLLARSTRAVVQGGTTEGFSVQYVAFPSNEDYQLSQPATHIVTGRRGTGKSTLITRAAELIGKKTAIVALLDMQPYSTVNKELLIREIGFDLVGAIKKACVSVSASCETTVDVTSLNEIEHDIRDDAFDVTTVAPRLRRALETVTNEIGGPLYVFLDDFHLVDTDSQADILHAIHGALKGANGWLKVAGIGSVLNFYDPARHIGLQVPGDAQELSLDLTLEDPATAEAHLKTILDSFLCAVGYRFSSQVIDDTAFRRLVWATAGVPRDFLQMFARALEHARRNRHQAVTVSDVNIAIGEFGQRKMAELEQDARNEQGELKELLANLENLCLNSNKVNGFLLRSEESDVRRMVHILRDLRLVHLIHQSITAKKPGERYEAFILDYSLFTGFRRRQNIKEMRPEGGPQFKASELRKLPKVDARMFWVDASETGDAEPNERP